MTVRSHRERALKGLQECIRQMDRLAEGDKYAYRVFMNDDASSDGIADDIRERFPDVSIIKSEGNLSWGGGIRAAWLSAAAERDWDFYLWLDYDLELRENAVMELFETSSMLRHRCILTGTSADVSGKILGGGRTSGGEIIPPDDMIPLPCHTFDGAVVLVPGEIYKVLGPLNEDYRHALAAADYGIRAFKAGIPRMVTPGITGTSSRTLPPSDDKETFRYNIRSRGLFFALKMRLRCLFKKSDV